MIFDPVVNLIFEGVDNSGKSTAIQMLTSCPAEHGWTYHKRSHYPTYEDERKQNTTDLVTLSNVNRRGHIFDRAFMSGYIYAPIVRDYDPLYLRSYERLLSSENILFVFTAEHCELFDRFDGEYIKPWQIASIDAAYRKAFIESPMKNKFLINTSFMNRKEVSEYIDSVIRRVIRGVKNVSSES